VWCHGVRADIAGKRLSLVEDASGFFDPDTRANTLKTAKADLAGSIARVIRALVTGRLPVAEFRAQIGRIPLPDLSPSVPPGR
jgi:hypothetical protein